MQELTSFEIDEVSGAGVGAGLIVAAVVVLVVIGMAAGWNDEAKKKKQ
ncbi:hypothetical protein [uncultured Massilia sp.]|nr:hypothetical protein [uncultured Massilia sp.]